MADTIDNSGAVYRDPAPAQSSGFVAPDGSVWPDEQTYLNSIASDGTFGNTSAQSQGQIQPSASELSAYNTDRYNSYIQGGGDPRKLSSNFNVNSPLSSDILASGQSIDSPYVPTSTYTGGSGGGYSSGGGGSKYAPYDLGSGKTKWDEIVATLQNQKDLEAQRAQNSIDVENLRGLSAKQVEDIRAANAKAIEDSRAAEQRHQVDTGSNNDFLKELMAEKGPKDPYSYLFNSRGMMAPQGYSPAPLPLTDGILQGYKNSGVTDMKQIQSYLTGGGQPSLSQWGVLGSMPSSLDAASSPYGQVVGNAKYGTPDMQTQQNAGTPLGTPQSTPSNPQPTLQVGTPPSNEGFNGSAFANDPNTPVDPSAQLQGRQIDYSSNGQPIGFKQVPNMTPPSGLPSFDNGGHVPGSTGQPVLAVVHAGETIRNPRQEALIQQGIKEPLPVQPGQTHFANGGLVVGAGTYAPNYGKSFGDYGYMPVYTPPPQQAWQPPVQQQYVPQFQHSAGITYQQPPPPRPVSTPTPMVTPNENRGPGWPGNHGQLSTPQPAVFQQGPPPDATPWQPSGQLMHPSLQVGTPYQGPHPTPQPPVMLHTGTPPPNEASNPTPANNAWGGGLPANNLPAGAKWTDTNPATGHPYNSTWNPTTTTWQVTGGTPYVQGPGPTRPQNVAPVGYWAQHTLPTGPGTSISHNPDGSINRVVDGDTGNVYDGNGNLLGVVANHGGGQGQTNSPGPVVPSVVAPTGTHVGENTPVSIPAAGTPGVNAPPIGIPKGTPAPGSTTDNGSIPGVAPNAIGTPAPNAPPVPAPVPIGATSGGSGTGPIGTQTPPPSVPGSGGKPPFDLNKLDPYTRSLVDSNGRPIPPSAQQWKDMPSSGKDAFQNYSETVAGVNFQDLMDTAKNLYPVAGAPLANGFK